MDTPDRRQQAKEALKGYLDELIERNGQMTKALKHWWGSWHDSPSSYEDDPQFREAMEFSRKFEPLDEADYEWVCDYAKHTYELLSATFRYLDEKADSRDQRGRESIPPFRNYASGTRNGNRP